MKTKRRTFLRWCGALIVAPVVTITARADRPLEAITVACLRDQEPIDPGVIFPPCELWAALSEKRYGDCPGGREPLDPSYRRVRLDTPATRSATRHVQFIVQFPAARASWGPVVAWGIFSSPKLGDLLISGELEQPQIVRARDRVVLDLTLL